MICQILVSGEKEENIANLLFAEFAQRVVTIRSAYNCWKIEDTVVKNFSFGHNYAM